MAIARHDLAATDRQAGRGDSHLAEMSLALFLERTLLEVVDLFDGLESPIGSSRVRQPPISITPTPSLRSFDDIDLLVPSRSSTQRPGPSPRPATASAYPNPYGGFDRRLPNGTSFPDSDDTEFNLHRTLVMGPYGLSIDLDELWASSSTFVLAAQTIARARGTSTASRTRAITWSSPTRLHAWSRSATSRNYSCAATSTWTRSAGWQSAGGPKPLWREAVRSAWETLSLVDANALSFWAQHYEPEPWERRALSVYQRPDTSYAARSLASVSMIQGVSNKLAYLRGAHLPEARPRGPSRELARALAPRPARPGALGISRRRCRCRPSSSARPARCPSTTMVVSPNVCSTHGPRCRPRSRSRALSARLSHPRAAPGSSPSQIGSPSFH